MSRNIAEKSFVTISAEEAALHNTSAGKLIFTLYKGKQCAVLIKANRLTAACILAGIADQLGAVYIGKVKNVTKNINACFVEIADREICFLSLKDADAMILLNRKPDGRILAGDELLVQVTREAQKNKQASVTSGVSLSNDYFVLKLGENKVDFSAKLDKQERNRLSKLLKESGLIENGSLKQGALPLPETTSVPLSVGMIVRTRAAELLDADLLLKEFKVLAEEFSGLLCRAFHRSCFSCLKKAPEPYERVLKQFVFPCEFDEIITDDEKLYGQLLEYAQENMPEKNVRLYTDKTFSLNSLYSLDTKLEEAFSERVWLKSGAYLVIQPTEALTVIDVNSGKYEADRDSEKTALKVNLEAAVEIARQLRLRNLSGIIVADFINMQKEASRQELLRKLRELAVQDRVQTTVVDMTPLGLVELTRKKEYKPLSEQFRIDKFNRGIARLDEGEQ